MENKVEIKAKRKQKMSPLFSYFLAHKIGHTQLAGQVMVIHT